MADSLDALRDAMIQIEQQHELITELQQNAKNQSQSLGIMIQQIGGSAGQ